MRYELPRKLPMCVGCCLSITRLRALLCSRSHPTRPTHSSYPPPGMISPGYSAGLLITALMLGRIISTYYWGVIADRYGRRPVIFVSLWATAIFAVAFGFSTSFVWAFACRCDMYQQTVLLCSIYGAGRMHGRAEKRSILASSLCPRVSSKLSVFDQ